MTEQFRLSAFETQRIIRLETGAIDTEHYRREALAMRRSETKNLLSSLVRAVRAAMAPKPRATPATLARGVM